MKADELRQLKYRRKVTVLTAYDTQMARIQDNSGVDIILVGDSLGMVVLGYDNTRNVTMNDMIRHTGAVSRGVEKTHIVADMPVNSFNTPDDAVGNAKKLVAAGAHSVKIEGRSVDAISAILREGIPVMGHVGLLPQTAEVMKVKGKKKSEAEMIIEDAEALDKLGVYAIVLECIPAKLGKMITERVEALTIGIGAGVDCDGQVLVVNDMLGMDSGYVPKHAKVYVNLNDVIGKAVREYIEDVKKGKFPDDDYIFH